MPCPYWLRYLRPLATKVKQCAIVAQTVTSIKLSSSKPSRNDAEEKSIKQCQPKTKKKNYRAKEKSPINSDITTEKRVTKSETIPNGKKQLARMAVEKGSSWRKLISSANNLYPSRDIHPIFSFSLASSSEILLHIYTYNSIWLHKPTKKSQRRIWKGEKSHNNSNINRGQMYFPAFGCSPSWKKMATFRANVATDRM